MIYCRHFSVFKIEKFARFSPAILTEVQCLYGNPMSKDNRKRYLSLVPTRSILFRRPRKAWNGRRKPNTILLIKFVACSSLLRSMQSHFQFSIHYVCLYDYDKTESKSAVKFSTKNATARERLPLQHLEFIKLRKWIFFLFSNNSWFQGCIALLRYSSEVKTYENVKLLGRSNGVWENCSGEACSSSDQNKCEHGGICVDLVVTTQCDCEGTGYDGRFCERSGMIYKLYGFINFTNHPLSTTGP